MEKESVLKKIGNLGILPVIALPDADCALPLAEALISGNIPAIEITLRTPAAYDGIKAIAEKYPDMVLGAGTVLTPEQADRAVECGAGFIVSPGFDAALVRYCLDKGYTVIPGISGASELQQALAMGLTTLKFFPAEKLGGADMLKQLHSPFPSVKFIATGGISVANMKSYLALPCVSAVGGSFVAPAELISAGEYAKITELCKKAVSELLGFSIGHVGINCGSAEESMLVAKLLSVALNVPVIEHPGCNFSGTLFEVLKSPGRGKLAHIAILTDDLMRAADYVERNGIALDWEKATYFPDGKRILALYFKEDIAGFALHLLQKR